VIKPDFPDLWCTSKARACNVFGEKAVPVWSASELSSTYESLVQVDPRLIVQQMVVGPDANHLEFPTIVDPDGDNQTEFVARKLRLAPAHFGMGCYVESIRCDEVVETARGILRVLGYRGVAMVQFKRDERDGKLYLLEINPRFTVWTSLPVACGVDLPYYYYRASLGEPFSPPTSHAIGKTWWDPVADVVAMKAYFGDGTWNWWRWLITILRRSTNAYFTWDDPMPGLTAARYLCRRIGHAVWRHLMRSRECDVSDRIP
jgi:predicted ATP-grasp superfamily ATP-dependent carboligase